MSNKAVTSLPPVITTIDAQRYMPGMAEFMQSFRNSWSERSGLSGDRSKRWLTIEDVQDQITAGIVSVFGNGASLGFGQEASAEAAAINRSLDMLADEIRKSMIYQLLEQAIPLIDLDGVTAQVEEALGNAYAALGVEQTVRAGKDDALASAINQIWAQVGGASAVIQDGQLAAVSPSGATATKWNQVVAAVTDPNTGNVNSSSIKQELNTYANSANATFNASYTLRAQIDINGRTVIGGFGLAATTGAGSSAGPTIDAGFRVDKFFVAATASTPDGTTQENQGTEIPFMVLTYAQYVNGQYYNPGVYMKRATIGDATIGTAKIADAAITNAKIGGDIASTNFVGGGVAGWYLSRGGYFECSNIYARGNILATSVSANTITADQVISNSLNNFYTTTSGVITTSHSWAAQAVRITCYPGFYSTGGKDGNNTPAQVTLRQDGVNIGTVVGGAGFVMLYNVPAGSHTYSIGSYTGSPSSRLDVEVILR